MGVYRLTVVDYQAKAHTTTFDGYYAESAADQFFNMAIKDSRCIFACVDDGPEFGTTLRRTYVKRGLLRDADPA